MWIDVEHKRPVLIFTFSNRSIPRHYSVWLHAPSMTAGMSICHNTELFSDEINSAGCVTSQDFGRKDWVVCETLVLTYGRAHRAPGIAHGRHTGNVRGICDAI